MIAILLGREVWPWLSSLLWAERQSARELAGQREQRRAESEQQLIDIVLERLQRLEAQDERTRSELRDEFRANLQPSVLLMNQLVTELRERMPRVARTRETDRTADAAANGAARE